MLRFARQPGPKQISPRSKGQTIIIVALMFLMLMGFIGLVVDIGRVFIEWAQLRRAVDAASLAAAAQFREGRTISEMASIARQLMEVNGVNPTSIIVDNCTTDHDLCPTTPPHKYVRVTASSEVRTTFLLLFGVDRFPITTSAIGEAASLDVVLVIDISESMSWDAAIGDPMRDPHACNNADPGGSDGYPGDCHPFQEVKAAADRFVSRILDKSSTEEEDRLAIVTFADGWNADINRGTFYRPNGGTRTWINDRNQARQIIRDLRIYDPPECDWPDGSIKTTVGPCRKYAIDTSAGGGYGAYQGFDCYSCRDAGDGIGVSNPDHQDWSYYATTNIGGALLKAGNMFPLQERDDALWVVILLTDGVANNTDRLASDNINRYETYPVGFCTYAGENAWFPICQDKNTGTRHRNNTDPLYDADDYARDMADFVGCMGRHPAAACAEPGQGALAFSIGLGSGVLDNGCRPGHPEWCEIGPDGVPNTSDARPYGAELLRYVAAVGDDGNPLTNELCVGKVYTESCGNYFFAPQGSALDKVFEEIASRIFTRLHQ